jgi:hypothetical protein
MTTAYAEQIYCWGSRVSLLRLSALPPLIVVTHGGMGRQKGFRLGIPYALVVVSFLELQPNRPTFFVPSCSLQDLASLCDGNYPLGLHNGHWLLSDAETWPAIVLFSVGGLLTPCVDLVSSDRGAVSNNVYNQRGWRRRRGSG